MSPEPRAAGPAAPDVGAWPGLELVGPLRGGARSGVFRARRGPASFVVRVSRRPPAALLWELDLLAFLAAGGLAVPLPTETGDGRRHDGGTWVHPLLPGRPPRTPGDWRQVVAVLEQVHERTAGWPQRPGFASAGALLTDPRGGDVDLSALPADGVALIRETWRPLVGGQECVVHGDVNPGNVLMHQGRAALIDWDESRVDAPAFDFAGLPPAAASPRPGVGQRPDIGQRPGVGQRQLHRAGLAWEAASCWSAEPAYARRCLDSLRADAR